VALFRAALRAFQFLEDAGVFLAGLCLAAIMLVVTFDAVSRYVFNAPLSWAYDLITLYLLTAATFFIASSVFKTGGHITIDFLTQFMSANVLRTCTVLCELALLPVLVIMLYTTGSHAIETVIDGRFTQGVFPWPIWPTPALVSFGVALMLVRVIIDIIQQVLDVYHDKPAEEAGPQDDVL
jgi:TRAP-type C4-dicarboxylate transport system permease small subunit